MQVVCAPTAGPDIDIDPVELFHVTPDGKDEGVVDVMVYVTGGDVGGADGSNPL